MKKRFILVLLLIASIFTLAGCAKGPAKYLKDINQVINTYSKSLNGSVKFEEGTANDLIVTDLIYSYKLENKERKIVGFMSKQVRNNEETSIYVKDNIAYMLLDGQKTKATLTDEDVFVKVNEYGFDAFIKSVNDIYDTNFFKAVKVVSKEDKKVVLELDLEAYKGEVINKSGQITKFEVVLHYDGKNINKIENKITRAGVVNLINVSFNSTAEVAIEYPADLSSYK